MATVQTALVDRAFRMIGQGRAATSTESADILVALNALVDVWKLEKLMVYAFQEESLTLTAGAATKTLGPSGSLTTTRPVAIERAWTVDSLGVSRPCDQMVESQYAAISLKTQQSDYPTQFLYRGTVPDATLVFYPVPNGTVTSMKLLTRVQISAFALVDTLAVPPGYELALASNLAVHIAPDFETVASDDVKAIARMTKMAIKANNTKPIPAESEMNQMFSGMSRYNVNTDV